MSHTLDKAKPCDYAHLPHSGGGTNHGPVAVNLRGYDICQKCYDAITEAEYRESELYERANIAYDIDRRSSCLQRKCFL